MTLPASLPPILALAAPEAVPAARPVTLPTDVLAALSVIARFHDAQLAAPAPAAGMVAGTAATQMAAIGK